ncbi:MAG: hypothetical protein HMLKMBBP_01441 [Planctomycetes bacterium]|nr:hypothetical protein [Planctomycetota bacterium]
MSFVASDSVRHTLRRAAVCAAFALGALAASPAVMPLPPAEAKAKTHVDKQRGFQLRIEEDFTQVPPKLTNDESYLVGEWYQDAAKYDSGYLRPEFKVFWFVEPKDAKPGAESSGGSSIDSADEARKAMMEQFRIKDFDQAVGEFLERNEHLFGKPVPVSDRWKAADRAKTAKGVAVEEFEVNAPSKKKPKDGEPELRGYAYAARLTIDHPKETIRVGFMGTCSVQYAKDFQKQFPAIVRSFEELKTASDVRNEGASADLAEDPAKMREQVKATKLIKGWKAVDTENYLVVHHEDVDPKLAKAVGVHIEALRAQVYEVLFPPDKPITAVSVVRVCKDQEQYFAYGGPGGSAGYWYAPGKELVFYDDNSKDSLSVLYHEAFHQYIYYSVGDFSPHSWFNEGHGDYFAGHQYEGGKFVRKPFQWRLSLAKEWKRNPARPKLKEWLQWSQMQYYGGNKEKVPIGANYALGWSFVYFLRTTKKPEYQGILDRYFKSLKGSVTANRALEEALGEKIDEWKKKYDEWEKKAKDDPENAGPPPERPSTEPAEGTSDLGGADRWLKRAVEEALRGVDLDQLEKDWLASEY